MATLTKNILWYYHGCLDIVLPVLPWYCPVPWQYYGILESTM